MATNTHEVNKRVKNRGGKERGCFKKLSRSMYSRKKRIVSGARKRWLGYKRRTTKKHGMRKEIGEIKLKKGKKKLKKAGCHPLKD